MSNLPSFPCAHPFRIGDLVEVTCRDFPTENGRRLQGCRGIVSRLKPQQSLGRIEVCLLQEATEPFDFEYYDLSLIQSLEDIRKTSPLYLKPVNGEPASQTRTVFGWEIRLSNTEERLALVRTMPHKKESSKTTYFNSDVLQALRCAWSSIRETHDIVESLAGEILLSTAVLHFNN